MNCLIIYSILTVLVACGFFYLNRNFKWVTKGTLNRYYDGDMVTLGLILGILLWPITIIVLLCEFIWHLIVKYLIPS